MITGGREKGALVSTSEGIAGASGTSTTCPGDASPSLGSPEPWRGWFWAVVLALLSGLFPPFPDFLWRREVGRVWRSLKASTRVEEAWSQDLHLPCPGSNRAKACMVLAQLLLLLVCFCGACRNWPFTCPSRSGWLKRWAIVLGTDYALTVW